MTTQANFTADEWSHIIQVPRWVVTGAAAVGRHDTQHKKTDAGFLEIANWRRSPNAFVKEVATACVEFFDSTIASNVMAPREPAMATATVLERLNGAVAAVKARGTAEDVAAYGLFIVAITDAAIEAGKSGILGIPRAATGDEKRFREAVAAATAS